MKYFARLAFGFRLNGIYRTYAVGYDDSGANAKPYAVFYWAEPNGVAQQISPWYAYRGWAERFIRKLHQEKQKHWVK